MGSGASAAAGETPGADLRLPASGLKFTINQLRALNSYLDTLFEEDQKGRMSIENESLVESVVQRIVDGAGQRDPRFRCCHLIALHRGKTMRSRSLEYLVTLDSLPVLNAGSPECCLQEGPVGYGKVRLAGRVADKWEEFLTPSGYLCRDKIVERWVELVARCAHARGGGGCRVLCARAASYAQPFHYCYLEKVSPVQTSNERLAIVEGAAWVLVRVGQMEAKLVVGARVGGCSGAGYTCRVPLTHPLAMLHYTIAQAGYYAVAVGPPSSVVCSERSATWQLWHPALEAALDRHCSDLSTVARIAGAVNVLIDKMREGFYQGSLRLLSRYAASCALRRRLDQCSMYQQTGARACVSAHASHHMLLTLDWLLSVCEHGFPVGYVFPTGRGTTVRRGARDGDWTSDATAIRNCLLHLHRMPGEDIPLSPSESLETVLFSRWENLNKESKAATGSVPKFSRRQLRYLWRVANELVNCKNMVTLENHSTFRANLIQATSHDQEPVEDLIHILAIMLDQARDVYVNNFRTKNADHFDRELSTYRSKKWNKLKNYYDASSACLIDAVRRDQELRKEDLKDEATFMKNLLNWLYKGAKDDKKYLAPVLKPYLDGLFYSSLENAWFLEDFDGKNCEVEFEGLQKYCLGVHDGNVDPCMGLLDVAKRLAWAKAMVDFLDRYKHIEFRLVFPTGEGLAVSYPARLPSRRSAGDARTLTLGRRDKADAKRRLATRCVQRAFSDALLTGRRLAPKEIPRYCSTDEILASVKTGNYWRNSTKPDIIPSNSISNIPSISTENLAKVRKKSRKVRPVTAYGFPEISITNQSDTKTLRKKYHTLKSLVYKEQVETIKELKRRPHSAGSTVKNKEALSRPSLLETLDFINSVKDALCVEESGASDVEENGWSTEEEWLSGQVAPLNLIASRCGGVLHLTLGDLTTALLNRGRFTILQELCSWLGASSEAALFALHRLARAARSRSSERTDSSWQFPTAEHRQQYRARGEEPSPPAPTLPAPPSPPPRHSSKDKQITQRYSDRLQELEHRLNQLNLTDLNNQQSALTQNNSPNSNPQDKTINYQHQNKYRIDKNSNLTHNKYTTDTKLTKNNLTNTKPHLIQKYHSDSKTLTENNQPKPTAYLPDSKLSLSQTKPFNESCTGILNPIYDIKMPRDKFSVKRSKSLGRTFSTKRLGLEVTRYNITLGHKSGKRTNDVVTAITGMTGETGLDSKGNFFQRNTASVVGDSYRISRITID